MISTKYGLIEGVETKNCIVFRGIPFAKPPVGELRFKRPVRPDPWEGVLNADHFGNQSVQRDHEPGTFYTKEFYSDPASLVSSSEDCLYLNIWMPKEAKAGDDLPVAIYIHGGAFMGGAGSNVPFDGEELAKRGIILVTCNYRLGVLGFMCHPLLTELQDGEPCGNYGMWDQAAALDWVRENISAFGGDPEQITWFGQSAGAMSLQIHCVSPVTEGKYSKMIMQSGGGYHNPIQICQSMEDSYEVGEMVLSELGFDESWKTDDTARAKVKEALMTLPAEKLTEAGGPAVMRGFATGKGIPFIPVIDGEFLPASEDERIKTGAFHKIPYILGSNSEDMMAPKDEEKTAEDRPMHMANVRFAQAVNADPDTTAYVYYFKRQLPGDEAGAFHSAELWYVFGDLERCWRPWEEKDYTLCREIMDRWSAFIHTGCPDYDGSPAWRPCTEQDAFVEILDA